MEYNPPKIEHQYPIQAGITFEVIKYEGHTFIYWNNNWNHSGDAFIHDPSCKKCAKDKDKHE